MGVLVPEVEAGVEGGTGVVVPEAGGVFIGTSGILAAAREQLNAALGERYARLSADAAVSVWLPLPPTSSRDRLIS